MHLRSKRLIYSLTCLSLFLLSPKPSQAQEEQAIFSKIEELVKKTYPHAKVTREPNKLHFESKIKTLVGYYSKEKMKVPDAGGIMGDITVEPGEYNAKDKHVLSNEQNEGVMSTLKLAPYNKVANNHLLAKLYFPLDTTYEFKDHMKTLIKQYGSSDTPHAELSKEELHKKAMVESQKDVSNWVETSTLQEQLELGLDAMKRHNWEGARRHYRAASLIAPTQTDFYPKYYEACQRTGNWVEAQEVAAKLVKTSPENERLYIEKYADALVANKEADKATEVLRRALQLSIDGKQKTRLYHALLQIAINKHNDNLIESTSEELLKISPDEDDVRARLLEIRKKKKSQQ